MSIEPRSQPEFVTVQLRPEYDYLAPDGSEIRLLPTMSGGGLAHCTLPPGGITKAVRHQTVEEIWFGLSGEGEVWRKLGKLESVTKVTRETSLTIPTGAHFQFRNNGDAPFCFLIVTMPPWPGQDEALEVAGHWISASEA